jgi:hypothetical protein
VEDVFQEHVGLECVDEVERYIRPTKRKTVDGYGRCGVRVYKECAQ